MIKKKNKMTTRKLENIIRFAICFSMLLIALLHPRVIYWIAFGVCVIRSLICFLLKKEKYVWIMWQEIALSVISIAILCYWGQCLNIIWPNHATYEYRTEIAKYKANSPDRYYHFPDKIPKGAKKVEWVCLPSALQGTGYRKLFFYTDISYLQKICDAYAEEATLYTLNNEYRWEKKSLEKEKSVNEENQTEQSDKYFTFSLEYTLDETEWEDVEVYVLYDNHNTNHHSDSGFFINWKEGYIGFWAE